MKTAVRLANVLSWINLVYWGFSCAVGLLMALASGSMLMIVGIFFISSIILHSYAAIQLNKSIRDPARPLSRHTPAGIRFIGIVAITLGILCIALGNASLQHPQEILKAYKTVWPDLQATERSMRANGVFALLLGISIATNVILNFRLLRWYYLMKENKDNP